MQKYKASVVIVLLIALAATLFVPAAPAYAMSINDLTASTTGKDDSASKGIIDILIGLLLGKFLGNIVNNDADGVVNKVLGLNDSQTAAPKDTNQIISTAKQYMGVPYVWGGSTPAGFDCSGFTQYVMQQNGITIPRTAEEQYNSGTSILKSNLRVGDLVFFTTYKPGASHVGFYMGDGKFIHASSAAKEVTISSLNEPYYTEHYIGARRYSR